MSVENKNIGRLGEEAAIEYLKKLGYNILYRNYSKMRWGEIDIIAELGGEIVFVEVKTRTTKEYGNPEEAITPFKLKALKRSALYFLQTLPPSYRNYPCRIDLIGIIMDKKSKEALDIRHFKLEG